jgi:hypothetical protein
MLLYYLFVTIVFAQCRQRKEIRNLTSVELSYFNKNFVSLYNNTDFKNFVKLHSDLFPLIHNTPIFLPFHRLYLQEFEDRFMNNSFGVPWIDWGIDAKNVSGSIVFTSDYFGSNDQDGKIINSVFSNTSIAFPENEMLKRKVDIISGYTEQIRQNIINKTPGFSNFSKTLEIGIHGLYHSKLTFTMNTVYSPNEPLFFLHHGFIDKLWNEWQTHMNDNLNFDSDLYSNKNFTLDSLIPYFNISIRDALNTPCLNYTNTFINYTITNVIPERPTTAFLQRNKFTIKEVLDNDIFNLMASSSKTLVFFNYCHFIFFINFFF